MTKITRMALRLLRDAFWIAATGAILFAGFTGFQALKSNRSEVTIAPSERPVTVVETRSTEVWTAPLPIRGEGFVEPLRSVTVALASGGVISHLHPSIIAGRGTFSEGDLLVQLNDSSEQANLKQTEASIASARAQFELEQSSLDRARTLFGRGAKTQKDLDNAQARHDDARARLDGFLAAREAILVALENKTARAVFDGAILSKSAEVGSVVGSGQAVAEAFTDQLLLVDVNLSEAEAALIPGLFNGAPAPAQISLDFAGKTYLAEGVVKSTALALDARTRTLSLSVAFADGGMLEAKNGAVPASGPPPILVNTFSQVMIDGLVGSNLFKLPSTALHNGSVYLLVDEILRIVPARPVHVDGEMTFAEIPNLPEGGRLVVSTIIAPVDGMALRDLASVQAAPRAVTQLSQELQP